MFKRWLELMKYPLLIFFPSYTCIYYQYLKSQYVGLIIIWWTGKGFGWVDCGGFIGTYLMELIWWKVLLGMNELKWMNLIEVAWLNTGSATFRLHTWSYRVILKSQVGSQMIVVARPSLFLRTRTFFQFIIKKSPSSLYIRFT